ncbi:ABC transporter G family member 44 [Nymphaea thermarum]|nr:ABC transporter G family member 44 [Nymphaea thermarum]
MSGVLTALMGVSGAGKTTLMDVLFGRKTGGHIEGDIWIGGYPKVKETFARISGYCEQTDIHSPHVFINKVLETIELDRIKDALVGIPSANGLSMEQRKCLTIAVELVANPSIIFLDEPTLGLDARGAAIVMHTVRNAVNTGRTVVCTIHQPSIDIFESFDEQIPKWWIWLYWIIPSNWIICGVFTSQYGDIDKEIDVFGEKKAVSLFLKDYFGFRHDQLGVVAVVLIAYAVVFASLFAYCISKLNFQRR